MEHEYMKMLSTIKNRLEIIERLALEDDTLNEEYIELLVIQNSLYKLIKLPKEQNDEKVS